MKKLRTAVALVAVLGMSFAAAACTSPVGPECDDAVCYDLGSDNYDLGSDNYDLGSDNYDLGSDN